MANTNLEINPLLVHVLTDEKRSSIPDTTTFAILPGKYSKIVNAHKKRIEPVYKENKRFLICGNCGRKGKYDLGHIVFHYKRWVEDGKRTDQKLNPQDYMQSTGYFRCKHCNSAGSWETSNNLLPFESIAGLMNKKKDDESFSLGELRLFDGTTYQWATDAEEIYLYRLQETKQDGYLWNRLGNLYHSGNRPELAAAAFEQSIRVDVTQIESHFTLGELLMQVGEWESAAYHFHMMVLHARCYQTLDAFSLRKMLAVGLQNLYHMHTESQQQIPFLPTEETWKHVQGMDEAAAATELPSYQNLDLQFDAATLESFFPLAELFMGAKADEIPENKRTLDQNKSMHKTTGTSQNSSRLKWSRSFSDPTRSPIHLYVRTEEKANRIAAICEHYQIDYTIEIHYIENITTLKKAIVSKVTPLSMYDPCTCNSGQKFKFCCAAKMKNIDIETFIETF